MYTDKLYRVCWITVQCVLHSKENQVLNVQLSGTDVVYTGCPTKHDTVGE